MSHGPCGSGDCGDSRPRLSCRARPGCFAAGENQSSFARPDSRGRLSPQMREILNDGQKVGSINRMTYFCPA